MRSVFVLFAAMAATVVAGGPAAAQDVRKAPSADFISRLSLAAERAIDKSTRVYIVQMAAKPAVSFDGGTAGFAKTAPAIGERYDSRSSSVQMYAVHLAAQHDAMLSSVGAKNGKVYSYAHSMNGFAARMTAAQAAKISKNKSVLRVWEDKFRQLATNNSTQFLQLRNPNHGLRAKYGLRGRGVTIGMIDTGAIQEHPSYYDDSLSPPTDWNGICQAGERWDADDCNNKLIGARYFVEGFGQSNVEPRDFISARDSDGHGTHTSTTAAGRGVKASLGGVPLTNVIGMAPHAYLAIYKACWVPIGQAGATCVTSDLVAAIDAAVSDGVDIINYSIGTLSSITDAEDLAFLSAADAGVFVARAVGNAGPDPATTTSGEPWVMDVAASTQSGILFPNGTRIHSPATVAGVIPSTEGATTKPLAVTGPIRDDVTAANPIDACAPLVSPIANIALIARGTCDFTVKITNAVNAGARAVLGYTNENPRTVMSGDATPVTQSIPGVMIDNAPGLAILAELNAGHAVNVTLSAEIFLRVPVTGNVMASFSSRGPFPIETSWLKPDVTAPGVNILAGSTPEPAGGGIGGFFGYISGTSMSSPHIAGLAALIREYHPDWTPAQIKSAFMTTARQDVVKEDGTTPADPLDFGAGHVDPNKAIDPGLVYNAELFDYLGATCDTVSPLVSPDDCDTLESLGFSNDPANLNLPSIAIGKLAGMKTIRRTVTNIGRRATYTVSFSAPPGFRVQVKPRTLSLAKGESGTYEVTVTNVSAPLGEFRFGRLKWKDDYGHVVRSPIAVSAVAVIAPERVSGEGSDGMTSFDVAFGYNGAYTPAAHGLVRPSVSSFDIPDDPINLFGFDFGPDEPIVYALELPVGTTYARWSLFNAYNDNPAHDLDLYVFYCPDFFCSLVGDSGSFTSDEGVSLQFPDTNGIAPDPADADDPYVVVVHAYETVGGGNAKGFLFDWIVEGPAGNMTASGPSTAVLGATGTVDMSWEGLLAGPAQKHLGAVSHGDATAIQFLTIVDIDNDGDAGFGELCAELPPETCAPAP